MKFINKSTNFKLFQPIIIICFWALLFASPLLFGRYEKEIEWPIIFKVWLDYLPLLLLFLINRFLLLPKLFFKGKKLLYIISTSTLILLLTFSVLLNNSKIEANHFPPPPSTESGQNLRPLQDFKKINNAIHPAGNKPQPIPQFVNFLILAVLLVGFDTGLQLSMRWANLEQEKVTLQKEGVENQLAILKNQVSPHFFMNTLNNIHSLVDINSEEAKDAIIKLSYLMRYLLYESEISSIPIKKELGFIESYVELMRMRFSEKVKITYSIPAEISEKSIPPLLFTSLLENAFKHGISYNSPSFVAIQIAFETNKLIFSVTNSNPNFNEGELSTGIGIENTKKRLNLIYKNNYSLLFENTLDLFKVTLSIPI